MLRTETVEAGTLALIQQFMADPSLDQFCLAGGTALALQIGHRKSIDIDFFTGNDYDVAALSNHLTQAYKAEVIREDVNTLNCFVKDVKVDLLSHKYPLVSQPDIIDGIRMWSLKDITAMKLNAIRNNGTRLKDFIDVYSLLEHLSLQTMLEAVSAKYPDISIPVTIQSLLYHEDVYKKEPVEFIGPAIAWDTIAKRLQAAAASPQEIFKPNQQARKPTRRVGRQGPSRNPGPRM